MADSLQRTQVLLRRDQHQALADRAEREGRSVSELLRSLVDEDLERVSTEKRARIARRRQALDTIRRRHARILQRRGGEPIDADPTEVIREIREERDDELFGHFRAGGD